MRKKAIEKKKKTNIKESRVVLKQGGKTTDIGFWKRGKRNQEKKQSLQPGHTQGHGEEISVANHKRLPKW